MNLVNNDATYTSIEVSFNESNRHRLKNKITVHIHKSITKH